MHPWFWIETAVQDVRYGARQLFRNKGFTTTAVLSLALGVMAATAMYSVIYGVVLEPFPYKDVDNLVNIVVRDQARQNSRFGYIVDEYAELAGRATSSREWRHPLSPTFSGSAMANRSGCAATIFRTMVSM